MKNWLASILNLLPAVIKTVKAVEDTVQAPGATKRSIVVGIVKAGASAAEQVPDAEVQSIGQLVDVVVGELNKAGVFQHAPQEVAVAK